MKLYYTPWACSLAAHIALTEAGDPFELESVDLKTKICSSGTDFNTVTRKGYVPALRLDDGTLVTENIAVLDAIAARYPQFGLADPLGRTQLIEALAYISTEIHKSFKPFWHNDTAGRKAEASAYLATRLRYLADSMRGDYLFGDRPSVADFYTLVMTIWADRFGVDVPPSLAALQQRLKSRPAVRATLQEEGLPV